MFFSQTSWLAPRYPARRQLVPAAPVGGFFILVLSVFDPGVVV
jgi:hypothetical protein